MSHDTHSLDDATRRLDPVDADRLAAAWQDSPARLALFERIVSEPARATRPSRSAVPRARLVVVAVLGVLVLSAVGVSASGLFATREHDDSRMIRPRDTSAEIERLGADVPLPPGRSFALLAEELRDYDATQSEVGLAGTLAFGAACMWFAYWHDSVVAGDQAAVEAALTTLREIPTWTPLRAVSPDEDGDAEGDTVSHVRRLVAAAEAGDMPPVRMHLEVNCGPSSGWDGPTRSPFGPGGG